MTKHPITIGNTFQLGRHRLYYGNATDCVAMKKFLNEERVDLILTDPPYGVAYVENKKGFSGGKIDHKAITNDHEQSETDYQSFTRKWMEAASPFLALKNAFYVFNSDKMIFALRRGIEEAEYHFTQLLIWAKTHSVIGRMDYHLQHELIAYGWHGVHEFHKAKDKSLLLYPKPSKSKLHPTMKPVGLMRRLILNSTKIGQTVYDPFAGSGSTLIACEDTRRKCIAVEIDPGYCQVILERFEKHTGIHPEKLPESIPCRP
ncbi:MAG: site-specific DNA-methyltransferase [Candidatus Peregrinibacteria bacterium]